MAIVAPFVSGLQRRVLREMPTRSRIHSFEDARRLAHRRLPRLVFDFVEGAAGREIGAARNEARFDEILLKSRVLVDVNRRSLTTSIHGNEFAVPFGIAPMGMCNLACPGADRFLAEAAREFDMPVCLSSAGSSALEDMQRWAGGRAWFQLYFGQSAEASLARVDRAAAAGYKTLILTVDVPQISRRIRDIRNGFGLPFRMTARSFWDFATHPGWSLRMLGAGVPAPRNFGASRSESGFDRCASRSTDWSFLRKLRERWQGVLIVKGVKSPEDAVPVQELGADAIYVSNHGARQLDGDPPAIDLLPLIRKAVGPEYPLLFDSGVRNGEDVVKALAMGADFVMLGRPLLFALGAEGKMGLNAMLECISEDTSLTMAQLGITEISGMGEHVLFGSTTDGSG